MNASVQVVGLNTTIAASSTTNTAENIGFAIPINSAVKIANRQQGS